MQTPNSLLENPFKLRSVFSGDTRFIDNIGFGPVILRKKELLAGFTSPVYVTA